MRRAGVPLSAEPFSQLHAHARMTLPRNMGMPTLRVSFPLFRRDLSQRFVTPDLLHAAPKAVRQMP